jgi:hypothetical protein
MKQAVNERQLSERISHEETFSTTTKGQIVAERAGVEVNFDHVENHCAKYMEIPARFVRNVHAFAWHNIVRAKEFPFWAFRICGETLHVV